jgi:hypothetical protein
MEGVIERNLPHGGRTLADREGGHDPEKNEDDRRNLYCARPPDSAGFKDRIAHFTWPWYGIHLQALSSLPQKKV